VQLARDTARGHLEEEWKYAVGDCGKAAERHLQAVAAREGAVLEISLADVLWMRGERITHRSFRGHQRHGHVEHAVGEAPLVVIPAGHLDEAAGDLGER